jgi:uncharacterized membrane protein
MNTLVFVILLLVINGVSGFAHPEHDPPDRKKPKAGVDTLSHKHAVVDVDTIPDHRSSDSVAVPLPRAPLHQGHPTDEFPTLHPLIVHFPIMFLLIAAVLQFTGIFVFKREMGWIVLGLLIIGFATAYLASRFVHPHTQGLTERARFILAEHDLYADWTVWLSGTGLLLKLASHFVLSGKRWMEVIVAVVLGGAAYAVAMAGHHGAQLVHIEGVGPQGRYLEKHSH